MRGDWQIKAAVFDGNERKNKAKKIAYLSPKTLEKAEMLEW